MLDGKDIRGLHRLEQVVESYGIILKKKGANVLTGCCPFHKEKTPSFDVDLIKQLYYCHGCRAGGDVITFTALMDNSSTGAAMTKLTPEHNRDRPYVAPRVPARKPASVQSDFKPETTIDLDNPDKVYTYTDEFGIELYQILRWNPKTEGAKKTFRQRHKNSDGQWEWGMAGVKRVLYNLPQITKSPICCLTCGEKDADTLNSMRLCATTQSGGEGAWMDAYADTLSGKEVIIFGDNDDTGRKYVKQVCASLAGKVKRIRTIFVPKGKDITEYVEHLKKNGATPEKIEEELIKLVDAEIPLERGFDIPVYSIRQLAVPYRNMVCSSTDNSFDFGKILPTLGRHVRPARGGELITIMAATSVGKTLTAQLIAIAAAPMNSLFFQLELSREQVFERFISLETGKTGREIEKLFKEGTGVEWSDERLGHVFVCPVSKVSPEKVEYYINQSELVIGSKPTIVFVDYIQLMAAQGNSRYEKNSNAVEELRLVAKRCGIIIVLLSQVSRSEEEQYKELGLSDAKESGSIEQSSSLLLGLWCDREAPKMWLKVIKDSFSPSAGLKIPCMRTPGLKLVEVSTVADAEIEYK